MKRVVKTFEVPTYVASQPPRKVKILIDKETTGSNNICVGFFILESGCQSVPDVHLDMEEVYYITQGKGRLLLEGETYELAPGTAVYVPPGMKHQLFNEGEEELWILWAFTPHPTEYRHVKEKWEYVKGEG